ncbi:hypothetical protein Y032_0003g1419 [Ancylostoma ceylanicum]|uniref:Uncharacterized protein n=1 Tax=Ancylostoma ceylanicum TaxID=53326 RepID=A0A016VXU1_9BILA|nr:hypothetical protein Y032_0003g1419 [Ancylostoma ceylanicum]
MFALCGKIYRHCRKKSAVAISRVTSYTCVITVLIILERDGGSSLAWSQVSFCCQLCQWLIAVSVLVHLRVYQDLVVSQCSSDMVGGLGASIVAVHMRCVADRFMHSDATQRAKAGEYQPYFPWWSLAPMR